MRGSSLLFATCLLLLPSVAAPQSAPRGWRTQQRGKQLLAWPPDLKAGEVFVLGMQPDIDLRGQDGRDWVRRTADAKGAKLGVEVKSGRVEDRGGRLEVARAYRSKDGSLVVAVLSITAQPDGTYYLMTMFCSPALCDAYTDEIAKWERDLHGGGAESAPADAEETERTDAEESERTDVEETDPPAARSRTPAAPDAQPPYRTAPGRGIKPSQIEKWTFTMAGIDSRPVLLLKNGEFCIRVDVPAGEMDVAAHKRKFPGAWGRWRRRGDEIQRLDSDGARWRKSGWPGTLQRPRPGDEAVGGYHSSSGSIPMYGGGFHSLRDIVFLPGRRYRLEGVTSVSAPINPLAAPGGRTAGATSTSGGHGTYRFDVDTIELRGADGTVERLPFLWLDKQRRAFFMGLRFYMRNTPTRSR